VVVDREQLVAAIDLVGHGDEQWTPEEAAAELERRPLRDDIVPDPGLPADTAMWARLQSASGGLWGGCVYDQGTIVELLDAAAGRNRTP
jgi:xylonate dehydratase